MQRQLQRYAQLLQNQLQTSARSGSNITEPMTNTTKVGYKWPSKGKDLLNYTSQFVTITSYLQYKKLLLLALPQKASKIELPYRYLDFGMFLMDLFLINVPKRSASSVNDEPLPPTSQGACFATYRGRAEPSTNYLGCFNEVAGGIKQNCGVLRNIVLKLHQHRPQTATNHASTTFTRNK